MKHKPKNNKTKSSLTHLYGAMRNKVVGGGVMTGQDVKRITSRLGVQKKSSKKKY